MRYARVFPLRKDHPVRTPLPINFTTADSLFNANDPVLVWAAHRTKARGKVRQVLPGPELALPAAYKVWGDIQTPGGGPNSSLTPSLPGTYTIILVGLCNGKPTTYRSPPIRVK